jgi:hypothetical protein
MSVPRSVAEVLADHVTLEVEGIDRMYLNVYVPGLQREQGVACFFRFHRGHQFASSALMDPISKTFVAALEAFARREKVPVIAFRKGQRKDDVAAEQRKRFRKAEGVVFIGRAQEKTPVFRTERRRSETTGATYPWLVRSTAMVNHFYIYCVDSDFGPFFLKFSTYFPEQASGKSLDCRTAKKAIALDPEFPPGWNNLAAAYVILNRPAEAEDTIRQAFERKVPGEFKVFRYYIAFLRSDRAGMERAAAQGEGDPDLGDRIFHAEGCVLAWSGHLRDARKKSRQAVDSVRQATHKREHAATYNASMAVREAFFGNAREAREYAAAALDIANGRDVVYGAAFALAKSCRTQFRKRFKTWPRAIESGAENTTGAARATSKFERVR